MGRGGALAVIAAAIAAVGATGMAAAGRLLAARALLAAAAVLSGLALAVLAVAFWRVDTSLVEVATTTSRATAAPLRLAGLWGGPAGSLLCFATAAAIAAATTARRLPAVGVVALAAPVSALLIVSTWGGSFRRAALPPLDGAGLVPVLRRTSMVVHPPIVYAGLVLVLVAAAYGMAEVAGHADQGHRRQGHRVALAAWSLLAVGMVLGSRWAHREVGWGGVWAWDPVENAALLPWLALTAGFHHRSPRWWWTGAGLLAWAGIWATRSGRLDSVHAFSGQGAVGAGLGTALVAFGVVSAVMAIRSSGWGRGGRPPRNAPVCGEEDGRRWRRPLTGLLAGAAITWVGAGTSWAALGGGNRTVAASFYVSMIGPLAVAALAVLARGTSRRQLTSALLLGISGVVVLVLDGWRSPAVLAVAFVVPAAVTGVLARPGGRGVAAAHLGFVLIVAGGIATTTGQAGTVRLSVGDERHIAGLDVRLVRFEEVVARDHHGVAARLVVDGRDMAPALVEVEDRGPRADVATSSSVRREVQVALVSTSGSATGVVSVSTTPGATWVWGGGLLLTWGGLAEAVARRPKRRSAIPQPVPALEAS